MGITIDGLPVYYEEQGEGVPILCLHGFPVDHRSIKGCVEAAVKGVDGYRRIYLDLPGMGKTPSAKWIKNADDMVDLLRKFVGQVIGEEGFLLAGYSYGGYLALGMAHTGLFNIDGMFILAPAMVANHKNRKLPIATEADRYICKGLQRPSAPNPDFDMFLSSSIVANNEKWQRFKEEIAPAFKIADKEFTDNYRKRGYAVSCEDFRKLQFNKPVTVLCGRQDNMTGIEDAWDMLKHLPRLTYTVLDRVGHNLQFENPEAFNFHFKNWLCRTFKNA